MADRLLVFGAGGRTGRHLCDLAAASGFRVVAGVRRADAVARADGAEQIVADALDPMSLHAALAAVKPDAVISTIGSGGDLRADDEGVRNIADACLAEGVRRLVVITSLGCGGSRAYASARLLEAIGEVLAAKTRAESHILTLPLDWTIVRPGGLVDGAANGLGALFDDERVHGRITCRDLAALLLALAQDGGSVGKILAAVDEPSLSGPDDVVRYSLG